MQLHRTTLSTYYHVAIKKRKSIGCLLNVHILSFVCHCYHMISGNEGARRWCTNNIKDEPMEVVLEAIFPRVLTFRSSSECV